MRNAIHADLQSQVELLIDTICVSFPVGEKMFWEKKFGGKIFLGKKIGGKQIWGLGGKTFFGKNFGKTILAGKQICGEKNFLAAKIFFPRKQIWDKKSFIVIGSAVFEKCAINVSLIIILTTSINRHN